MIPLGTNMESQVMDYLVHDNFEDKYRKPGHGLFDLLYPWGLIWKARSRTIWFLITLGTNMESQVMDYLVHDNLED
jgi:hypothetical protein